MGIITGILTLYGLGMGVWLAGAGMKSALTSATDTKPLLKPICLSSRKSSSGRCLVVNEGYYSKMKKYVAEVICTEIDAKSMAVADTQEELERKINSLFEHLEWRLNKRREIVFSS